MLLTGFAGYSPMGFSGEALHGGGLGGEVLEKLEAVKEIG
jgi:hypothetical protein